MKHFYLLAWYVINIIGIIPITLHAQTNVSGLISSNTTWTANQSPVVLTGNVLVMPGATLTIDSGVTISGNSFDLQVRGSLTASGGSGAIHFFNTRILFRQSQLDSSKISSCIFFKSGIQIGNETEFVQDNPKNRGLLNVNNSIFNDSSYVRTKGYQTVASIQLSECKLSNAFVKGFYPRSEPMVFVSCELDSTEINSDAYNLGISFKKTNISFSKFLLGCCGANFNIDSSRILNSSFAIGMGNPVNGLVSITNTLLYNSPINLPNATFFIENSMIANYQSGFAIIMGTGTVRASTFASNGNGSGLSITGYAGYNIAGSSVVEKNVFHFLRDNIEVFDFNQLNINSNSFLMIARYALRNLSSKTVNASQNYWSNLTNARIDSVVYDINDNIDFGLVTYLPRSTHHSALAPLYPPLSLFKEIDSLGLRVVWQSDSIPNLAGYRVHFWPFNDGVSDSSSYLGHVNTLQLPIEYVNREVAITAVDTSINTQAFYHFSPHESWYAKATFKSSLLPVTLGEVCVTSPPIYLPSLVNHLGVFFGQGVNNDTLYPSIVGTGIKIIRFDYFDSIAQQFKSTYTSLNILALPLSSISADGLCVGTGIKTNQPDSNVVQINWLQNNQVVKRVNRSFNEIGEHVLGNYHGTWTGGLNFNFNGFNAFHRHSDGSFYIVDNQLRRVVRHDPVTETNSTVAGGNGSGAGLNQLGSNPRSVFVSANGDVYVSDQENSRVVRWSAGASQGVVVAGATGIGSASLNRLSNPQGIFVDGAGNLFIADQWNHRVVRWGAGATTGVLVGGGGQGAGLNELNNPVAVFVGEDGFVYATDRSNHRVLRYAPGSTTGIVVAGGQGAGSGLNQLNEPEGIFVDQLGNVYVADRGNNRVVRWSRGSVVGELVAGNGQQGSELDRVGQPRNVSLNAAFELFVSAGNGGNPNRIARFTLQPTVIDSFIPVQSGSYSAEFVSRQGCTQVSLAFPITSPEAYLVSNIVGGNGCQDDTAQLSTPQGAGYTYQWFKDGNQIIGATSSAINANTPGLYHVQVLDSNACTRVSESMRIWPRPVTFLTTTGSCLGSELKINTADSNVLEIDWFRNNQLIRNKKASFKANATPLVGNFQGSWLSNLEIQGLGGIGDVFVRNDSSIFILAQFAQSGICVVKLNPILNSFSIVAGVNGTGNGIDQLASFNLAGHASPGIFVTKDDAIYIADRGNHRVVKWLAGANTGILVAGGTNGDSLNQLSDPKSVYVNDSGDIYIADRSNHRIVKWANGASSGVIVAGGNGQGTGLNQLNNPSYLTMDVNGNLYVSDRFNDRVMRYSSGTNIGSIVAGGNGAGPSLNQLNRPNGIGVDKSGNVFIADQFNDRVVRWAPGAPLGGVVAGLNLGELVGLDRTVAPVALRLSENYDLFVTCANPLSGGEPQRLIKFSLEKMLSDTIFAQQGGAYNAVSTNINNCTSSTQTVTIFDPQLSFPIFTNACVTASSIPLNMATPSGGTYFGLGVDTGYFHPSIAGIGSHNLYYLYTDSNGCSKLDSQTIQVVPEPVVSIDTLGSMNLCQGESVTLEGPIVSGQSYQWYRNGVMIPQATQRSYTVRDTVSGQYHVMVTRNVCERSSDTLTVVVRPKPVVTIVNQGSSTICQGDSVVLQAASDTDVTYQWYRNGLLLAGSTQAALVANQSGTYTCQVAKANGCADTSNTLTLTVLDYPIAQITPASATTVCAGQAVVLNANQGAGLTHRWFRNGVFIAGATADTYQATQSGNYTVEVERQQLCATISTAIVLMVNPLPQISIQVAQGGTFCNGDSIMITAQSTSQVLRYAWFRNGQLLPSDSTGTYFARLPGQYHARVFDSAGCDKASDSVQLGYFNPPFANENICAISVDTLTGRNVVVWEKTNNVRTAAFNIYREGFVTGQYNLIGRVPFDSLSIFIDTIANPLSQSYRYRITAVDSCGLESTLSSIHRTIHLSSNIGVNNEVNLFWTFYEGVIVPTHRILRSINSGPFTEIALVTGSTFTYTDLTPPQGAKNYLIEIAIPGGCNPTGLRLGNLRIASSYGSIQSNKVAVGSGVSVINRSLAGLHTIYPNPSSGLLTLVRSEQQMGDQVFKIYDARGRLVRTIRFEDQSLVYQIDMIEAADGIYTIRANESNWSARFVIAK